MKRMYILIYSLFFSIAVFFSIKIPTQFTKVLWKDITVADTVMCLIIFLVSVFLFWFLNRALNNLVKINQGNTEQNYILKSQYIYLVILLCWILFYLAFYPGNLSPDSYASIEQALHYIYSTAHPVLFTLLVKVTMQTGLHLFGNMNAAIATFSITQMLVLDGILTYTIVWLQKHGVPKWFQYLTLAYFALHLLIVRYSFTMWKDILFSGVMLLLVLFLYDVGVGEKKLNDNLTLIHFLILATLVAFLRNRIIYAVIGIFILLLFIYRRYWKKLLLAFALTATLVLLIQGPLYSALNIKPSNFAEGQGVSLQQVAAVVCENGEISADEAEFINQIIPLEDIPKAYNPSTVDNLKGYSTFDHEFLNSHPSEYIAVWRSVFFHNPWICIKAWLMTTRGFWGFNVCIEPFAITWPSEELDIHQVNIIKNLTGIDLTYLSNGILVHIEDIPVVRRFFELGCLGWFGLFVTMRAVTQKRYKVLLSLLPLNLLWIVLIFSTPIFFEPRYMFVYNLALPVLFFILLSNEGECVATESVKE